MNMYDIDVKPPRLTVFDTLKTAWARLCANIFQIMQVLGCATGCAIIGIFAGSVIAHFLAQAFGWDNDASAGIRTITSVIQLQGITALTGQEIAALFVFALLGFTIAALSIGLPFAMYTQYTLDIYDQKGFSWTRLKAAARTFISYTVVFLIRVFVSMWVYRLGRIPYGVLSVSLLSMLIRLFTPILLAILTNILFSVAPFLVVEQKYNPFAALAKSFAYASRFIVRLVLLYLALAVPLIIAAFDAVMSVARQEVGFFGLFFVLLLYAFIDLVNAHVYRFFVPLSTDEQTDGEYHSKFNRF